MSVSMTFYSGFSKRENSTKQPSGGTSYSVVFKDAFSIIGGTVKLQANFDVAKNYTAASYGSNYYNVVDVVSTANSIVEITLALDVLATYKSNIASYTSMIERSPSNENINNIVDNTISPLEVNTRARVDASVYSFGVSFQIKTKNGNGDLAYFLDLSAFNALLASFEAAFWTTETQYIISTKVVPIVASASGGTSTSSVYIGNQNYPVSSGNCYVIKSQSYISLSTKTVATNSFVTTYSDERRYNNDYVNIQCKLNGEIIQIDSNYLRYTSFITESFIDPITLDVRIEVRVSYNSNEYLIASTNTNIGIGFMFTDVPNSLDVIVSTLSGVNKSSIEKELSKSQNGFSTIGTFLSKGYKSGMSTSTAGAPSGSSIAAVMYGDISFYITEYASTDKNPNELGYPYMKIKNINEVNLMGYYKFVSPQLSLPAISDVKKSVNAYLSSGIFYE